METIQNSIEMAEFITQICTTKLHRFMRRSTHNSVKKHRMDLCYKSDHFDQMVDGFHTKKTTCKREKMLVVELMMC